jgi:hypothetical protein
MQQVLLLAKNAGARRLQRFICLEQQHTWTCWTRVSHQSPSSPSSSFTTSTSSFLSSLSRRQEANTRIASHHQHARSAPLLVSANINNTNNMSLPERFASSRASVLTDAMEKPQLDNRTYRVVRLPNDLEALLIHDPDTDKASAAMDVNIGSFSDADDMPGMAHAVEHLLFMGTEKVC